MKAGRLVAVMMAVLLLPVQRVYAADVSATAAVLMDCATGQILYEKNADKRMRIASTTKILTALVVLDTCQMQQEVTVLPRHMTEGSSVYLKPGEKITVESLLYGLLLSSGNDAAQALADACGGEESCVRQMNALAGRIGMKNSHFENPSGLDGESHYSTARDMAKLAAYASDRPAFMRICSTVSAQTAGRTLKNHNRLLRQLDGCVGMKTGYTRAAGRTLVSCVKRGGRTLVAVTLQDGNDWADHEALYDGAFACRTDAKSAALPQDRKKFLI